MGLLVAGLCAPLVFAGGPPSDTALIFSRITTADGLADNAINRLYQDRAGFLWIGTDAGLNKYDGSHLWTWKRSNGLGGEQVSDMLVDDQGACWVATRDGGLSRIGTDGTIRTYRHDEHDTTSIATDRLTCLFDLNDSTLLIGAEQFPVLLLDKRTGRSRCWPGKGPFTWANSVARRPGSSDWCHYIQAIDERRIAIGFLIGHQALIVDRTNGNILDDLFRLTHGEQTISDVAFTEDLACGVGWQPGLVVRSLSQPARSTTSLPIPDEGTCLLLLDPRHALAGLRTKGLALVDLASGAVRTITHRRMDQRTLPDDRVRCLLRDDAGRLWVGTRGGLCMHDPAIAGLEAVPLYGDPGAGRTDLNAYRIDLDARGLPVVSTSDGLFVADGQGGFTHRVPTIGGKPQETTGYFRTPLGEFLGTEYGLYRYALATNTVRPVTAQVASQLYHYAQLFQVRNLYTDTFEGRPVVVAGIMGYGTAWFDPAATDVHLMITDASGSRTVGNNLTRELLRTRNGTYWAATPGGLFRWDLDRAHVANTFTAYRTDTPGRTLPGNDVQDLAEGDDGSIWVATRDGGLARIQDDVCHAFTCPRAAGNALFGLALDRKGRVWCTTANGLEVFDPATEAFFHIPVAGMEGSAALGVAIAQLADGRIGLVAENTFFIADPERAFVTRPLPIPYLTDLRVDGKAAMQRLKDNTVHLAADEHALVLSVSALRLTGTGPLFFTVRLEGVDDVPHTVRGMDEVAYASLPPGTFRLFARSVDSSGAPGREVLLAVVRVAAPFWQRWWFFALLAGVVSTGVFAWSRYRIRQTLQLHAVRDRIASDLHDEVGSSLSSITIGSQLAAQLSRDENEQVKQLIARIGETSGASLRSMSDIVWAIDPKNDEGDALVKRLRRIAQDLLESKGVNVSFHVSKGIEELKLPMDVRKDLLLIGKEAMHNASKHANARHVDITLARAGGTLTLSVKDDGKGFAPDAGPTGHGSGSMRRRAAALGSSLHLVSAPGMGTEVRVAVDLARIRD